MKNMDWVTSGAVYNTAYYMVIRKLRGVKIPEGRELDVCVSFEMQGNVDFQERRIRPESGVDADDPIIKAVEEALEDVDDQTLSLANIADGGFDEEGRLASGIWSLPITDSVYKEAKEKAMRAAMRLALALVDE